MHNCVLFKSQLFAGWGWPEELSHVGPIVMLSQAQIEEIKDRIPIELRQPFLRYTFGSGFQAATEALKHISVTHAGEHGWRVDGLDILILHRIAVGERYLEGNGIMQAKQTTEVRARSMLEVRREIKLAFPDLDFGTRFNKRLARSKMIGPSLTDFAQLSAPTTRPNDCRARRCGEKAENPSYGGVLCTSCRNNKLQVEFTSEELLEACPRSYFIAELTKPGFVLGLVGYPDVWFPKSPYTSWKECCERGRFLASGFMFDDAPRIFTERRSINLLLFRVLVDDGNSIARLSETEALMKLSLRLDRGPANGKRIGLELARFGVAKGPLLLNVNGHADQPRIGAGLATLRDRCQRQHAGGLHLIDVHKKPYVVLAHAVIALARMLGYDKRGVEFSFSVYEGCKPEYVDPDTVVIDAAIGFTNPRQMERIPSTGSVYVVNAHALSFGMLYAIVQTSASVIFAGSRLGKYGVYYPKFGARLGQAWYTVVKASLDVDDGNGTYVETTDDFVDAGLRSMLSQEQIGPCSVCEKDAELDGRDHHSDLLAWAAFGARPRRQCAAANILDQRTIDEAKQEAEDHFELLKLAARHVFES